jgi:hypothetical protein
MVRTVSRPAERDELPKHSGHPTREQAHVLEAACRENRIELIGPPLV